MLVNLLSANGLSVCVSEFLKDRLHRPHGVPLPIKLLTEQLHDFAIGQLLILGLDLALFAENERVLTIGVAVHVETLWEEKLKELHWGIGQTYLLADGVPTD